MNKKKSLRVLVIALAVVMVFGVCSTAFATDVFYDKVLYNSWTVYGDKSNTQNTLHHQNFHFASNNLPTTAWSKLLLNGNLESGYIINTEGVQISTIYGSGQAGIRVEPVKQGTHLWANGVMHIY